MIPLETKWKAFDVKAFIEGEWVKDIQDLEKAINDSERIFRKQVLERYTQQETEDLKEGFGLEDADLECDPGPTNRKRCDSQRQGRIEAFWGG